jgi:predicted nucleotidyltransferase
MNKEELYRLIKNYFSDKPVKKAAVFGSFARGDNIENSDIDVLIEMEYPVGLLTLGTYIADLQDITKRKIDLATNGAIRPEFMKRINRDLEIIYAK